MPISNDLSITLQYSVVLEDATEITGGEPRAMRDLLSSEFYSAFAHLSDAAKQMNRKITDVRINQFGAMHFVITAEVK